MVDKREGLKGENSKRQEIVNLFHENDGAVIHPKLIEILKENRLSQRHLNALDKYVVSSGINSLIKTKKVNQTKIVGVLAKFATAFLYEGAQIALVRESTVKAPQNSMLTAENPTSDLLRRLSTPTQEISERVGGLIEREGRILDELGVERTEEIDSALLEMYRSISEEGLFSYDKFKENV